ncbi:zinc-binding alcohol dehydrogenase [Neorhizobium sp. NCHU2750]|uniref:zinc-dependent alcohol dehydrogenase n=1 Tax=Neorhizobium sp. NCHU2750 TaxID=1825976 RepID=UPI000E73E13E|nr:dehydrogenase [Neorhizobium sp. NCHU2750]
MARALWLTDKRQAQLREEPLGALAANEVLIEARFSAISRGTEALVANGAVPVSEYERMRAPLQSGAFPFPVKYGYATVGKITAGATDRVGETVFCLHPHQDVFHAPVEMAIAVPPSIEPARAVLAANMETALNGVWDAGISPGDRVTIVGAGLIGLLIAFLAAAIPATRVSLVDLNPSRRDLAETFGCDFRTPDEIEELAGDADIVFHTSASAEGLATAISLAAFEARIVEMSWYGSRSVEIPLGGSFHSQRLSIVASQVGHVSVSRRARWPLSRRLETALALLDDDRLDLLVSGETAFEDMAGAYCGILADPATLCHRIRYR